MFFEFVCNCGTVLRQSDKHCSGCGKLSAFDFIEEENKTRVLERTVSELDSGNIEISSDYFDPRNLPAVVEKNVDVVDFKRPQRVYIYGIIDEMRIRKEEFEFVRDKASLVGNGYGAAIFVSAFFGIATAGVSSLLTFSLGLGLIMVAGGNILARENDKNAKETQRDIDTIRLTYGLR